MVLPGTQIVLAEKASEVPEKVRWVLENQVTGPTALSLIGQIWGIDLSDRDPDGPLPAEDTVPLPISVTHGTPRQGEDPVVIARAWREVAEAKNLTLRQVAIETSQRTGFAGNPGKSPRSRPAGCAAAQATASTSRPTWCRPDSTRLSIG
jgi:hypothetical protein